NSFFFFSSRRRHTRFSRDWSSDVCSSDLFELAIQVYDVRCFVERTDECVERSLRLALLAKRRVIEPADAKAESARHAEEIVDRQGETLFPDRLRRSFEIREAVLV